MDLFFVVLFSVWAICQAPAFWESPAQWARGCIPAAGLVAVVAALYTIPNAWAALWDVPVLCPCFNQKRTMNERVDVFLVHLLRFWRSPSEISALAAATGDVIAGAFGHAHMRFPPHDREYYALVEARFRAYGCVTGVRPCPLAGRA